VIVRAGSRAAAVHPGVLTLTLALLLGTGATPATAASDPPPAPAPAVLAPIGSATAPAPTAAGVRAAIGALVREGLGTGAAVVMDPVSGTVLMDRRGDRPLIPASTTKLATAAAALDVLGPRTRIPTTVRQDGDVLYLVGGGDPTLVRAGGRGPLAGGNASLRDLARSVAESVTGPVELAYDASAFRGPRLGPGWPASFPALGVAAPVSALVVDSGRVSPGATARVADPARQAARVFAALLRDRGLEVTGVVEREAPEGAAEIARVESAPVADIVERMLTDSDNDYAEALAHLVGAASLGKPTFAGGAAATEAALADLGLDTAGVDLADGSGLSRGNRIPARLLADLLTSVVQGTDPDLAPIAPGLAVAGLTGTLADRYTSAATRPGRGFVHAKTGTLTGVTSLAGTVLDADGRVLVFALLANTVPSVAAMRERMDVIASRLATCGCS
jgi:D-alanyl-D-alanine carboxypeptidase/D-alanyl-D-alanine-endopeptidase (penicillin-binding protein 4)